MREGKTISSIEAKMRKTGHPGVVYTREQVATHNTPESTWIIINGGVYDVTSFAEVHPGGEELIRQYAGKDATEEFYSLHRHEVLSKYARLQIGVLNDGSEEKFESAESANISEVPYAEAPFWRDGWHSPYYNESHKQYRINLRRWISDNLREDATALANMDKYPTRELYQRIGSVGLWAARLGPGIHMKGKTIFGIPGEEFDYFHELITHEEWNRITGTSSIQDGLGGGLVIGLPPVLHFGSPAIRDRVVRECLDGDKQICLAISEPFAGSDVANIQTTATLSEDGKYYYVTGVKKWITNGSFSDYFVTAVRTGGAGIGGISLILIERSEGLETKQIKTSYGPSAGTSLVIMENVKVPVENLLGSENGGFQCIMSNFNHERWLIIVIILSACRFVIEECFKWTMQRQVFGKKLISQPVIRQKLATMVGGTESVHSWLENITYQMCQMDMDEQFMRLGGPIAILKMVSTRNCYKISDDACQIFGGRAITKTGMGKYIEEFQRSVKYGAILGGSEEIMGDLGIRLAQRAFPPSAKL